MVTNNKYTGKGIAFPIVLNNGAPEILTDSELIKSSILGILAWDKGSFYFKGVFGSNLFKLIERPLDEVTLALIKTYIIEGISKFETRVKMESIVPFVENEHVYIYLKYTILNDNTTDSFIIPFINLVKY